MMKQMYAADVDYCGKTTVNGLQFMQRSAMKLVGKVLSILKIQDEFNEELKFWYLKILVLSLPNREGCIVYN